MMYVDDALMAETSRDRMELLLAGTIEAIFTVMGEPDTTLRQSPLAMNKWQQSVVRPRNVVLGIDVNTRRLSVAITADYRRGVLDLINSTWHVGRHQFKINEIEKLLGKLARLAKGARWIHHLMSHMYTSVTYALSESKNFLARSSREFKELVHEIKARRFTATVCKKQALHLRFAIKKQARMIHHSDEKFNINKTMRAELAFFRQALRDDSGISFETPIAHIIERTPTATSYGDACLEGCGGFSLHLSFWWHLEFDENIIRRTLKHKRDNSDGLLISINVLEYLTVIINYCAAYTVFTTDNVTDDPFPVLLNKTDNTSALNWTNHACKESAIGRMLGRFFCWLIIDLKLGINSTWISTNDNDIADEISRLKKMINSLTPSNDSSTWSYDYSSLTQKYKELAACRFFQPNPKLLSMLWDIVLTQKWPSQEEVQTLKQEGLGKLII
jgi:hypothetical protein